MFFSLILLKEQCTTKKIKLIILFQKQKHNATKHFCCTHIYTHVEKQQQIINNASFFLRLQLAEVRPVVSSI